MDPVSATPLSPVELVRLMRSKRKLWLNTTIACGALAAVFSLLMPRYWEAYQGLVVRQETAGSTADRPGKFADLYEMRTLQETILEVAKSHRVVSATLERVDRELSGGAAPMPTPEDVDKFRHRLKMLPPDGGEFGKTEVFYFSVKDPSRERAIRLVGQLCVEVDAALRELRADRARSLAAELEKQVALGAEQLAVETQRLVEFETQVGADLGELRMLHSANAGQSDLRTEAVQLEADARKFRTQVRESEQLLALLEGAEDDPLQLVATPNSLLTSQPALRRLKDGLVDAQLATSRLGGTRSPDHPRVRAAAEAERQIRKDLHDELKVAIRGAEVDLQLSRDRLTAAEERLDNVQQRLNGLAGRRAEYSNRVAAVDNCRLTLDRLRQDLSTAQAARAAAQGGSLVTRLDLPETGPYPAGPGRTVITVAGAAAGLMLGLGLVFLTAGPQATADRSSVDAEAKTSGRAPPRSHDAGEWRSAPTAPARKSPDAPEPVRKSSDAPLKAPLAVPAGVGSLPPISPGGYAGMSLQEALQIAARTSSP
jgi:uncharacterized protein involved in exopolysaccharide biosynthesis